MAGRLSALPLFQHAHFGCRGTGRGTARLQGGAPGAALHGGLPLAAPLHQLGVLRPTAAARCGQRRSTPQQRHSAASASGARRHAC